MMGRGFYLSKEKELIKMFFKKAKDKYGELGEDLISYLEKQNGWSIKLLLLAKDASKNSKEKAINFAKNSSIDLIELSSKEILGQAIGYEEISLVGIIDSRAAKAMKNKIESKGVK